MLEGVRGGIGEATDGEQLLSQIEMSDALIRERGFPCSRDRSRVVAVLSRKFG